MAGGGAQNARCQQQQGDCLSKGIVVEWEQLSCKDRERGTTRKASAKAKGLLKHGYCWERVRSFCEGSERVTTECWQQGTAKARRLLGVGAVIL